MMNRLFENAATIKKMTKIERKNYGHKLKLIKAVIENQGMTFASICRELKISSPKTLELINDLMETGIIEQNEKANSIGGRKPVLNKLRNSILNVLCIEIELFKVRFTVLDNNNNKTYEVKSYPFLLSKSQSSLIELINIIDGYVIDQGISWDMLIGIGISMPGLVHDKEGRNYTYMVNENDSTSIKVLLSEHFNKPVLIINDVKSTATAELNFGLAKQKKDVLVILMDWGIGLGIIMDGKLRNGSSGFSGEMGHMPFVEDGSLCYCGKKGCLETVASGIALARLAQKGILSGKESLLNGLSDQYIDKIEPQLVIDAANQGDQYAINILSSLGEKLGKGIAILIQLFNPELIILGGKIAEAKQYITIPIQQSINTYCMTPLRDGVTVKLSELAADAGAMGVSRMFLEQFFNEHITNLTT